MMMDNRELLELAAKAGEINLEWFDGFNKQTADAAIYKGKFWNPLTDDGDALRLAVQLRLTVRLDDPDAALAGIACDQSGAPTYDGLGPWFRKEWHSEGGSASATRRAITRAAAEIGKAMP